MKSSCRLVVLLTVCFLTLFCFGTLAQAAASTQVAFIPDGDVKPLPSQTINDVKKIWTIRFNRAVDPATVNNQTIKVTDQRQQVIPLTPNVSHDGMTVTVTGPQSGYIPGQSYRLTITTGVKAVNNGPNLNKTTIMDFAVKPSTTNPVTSLTLSADPFAGQHVNNPVILTAIAGGGSNPRYEFSIMPENGDWEVIQPFSAANTCSWIPTTPGNYILKVDAHSAGSTNLYEQTAEICYAVGSPGQATCTLWPEPLPPQPAGTPITLRATSQGIEPPEYTYLVVSEDGTYAEEVIACYTPATTVTWTPAQAGRTYHLRLWVGYQGSKTGTISDDLYFRTSN